MHLQFVWHLKLTFRPCHGGFGGGAVVVVVVSIACAGAICVVVVVVIGGRHHPGGPQGPKSFLKTNFRWNLNSEEKEFDP